MNNVSTVRFVPVWAAGAVLVLAALVYLFLFMGGLPVVADVVLLGGACAGTILAWQAYRQGKSAWQIGAFLAVGVLLCIVTYFGGLFLAAWPEVHPGSIAYTVAVTGLAGCTGTGVATALVPLPVDDEGLLYPESSLANQTFGDWTTSIVGTAKGDMLAFTTSEKNLTDIQAGFYRFETGIEGTDRPLREHFSPQERDADGGYLTAVSIEGLAATAQVSFDLRLSTGGGLFHGMPEDQYLTCVSETVPSGAGLLPVAVNVSTYRPGGPGERGEWVPV